MVKEWLYHMFGRGYSFVSLISTLGTLISYTKQRNIILPLWAWIVLLVMSFLYASFMTSKHFFDEYQRRKPEIRPKSRSLSIKDLFDRGANNRISSIINVKFSSTIEIVNHLPQPMKANVSFVSKDSDWELTESKSNPHVELKGSSITENPFDLRASDITIITISKTLSLQASNDTEGVNYINKPTFITLNWQLEPTGLKPVPFSIGYDISNVHAEIEQQVVERIRTQARPTIGENERALLRIFKKYWGVETSI